MTPICPVNVGSVFWQLEKKTSVNSQQLRPAAKTIGILSLLCIWKGSEELKNTVCNDASHKSLIRSVNPFGSYSPFCKRPLLLPCTLLANWHEHKHTPSLTHLTSMPNFSLIGRKLLPPKSGEFLWTN